MSGGNRPIQADGRGAPKGRLLGKGIGNLSPLLRYAWDSGHLPALDMHRHLGATGFHLSLIAASCSVELTRFFTIPKHITALPTAAS
jgi:hypothetical protein